MELMVRMVYQVHLEHKAHLEHMAHLDHLEILAHMYATITLCFTRGIYIIFIFRDLLDPLVKSDLKAHVEKR